jgi:carbamoyl-phosphate synthase small subunit
VSERQAALVLEDGTVFLGRAFGAAVDVDGEVVFCTAMTGYQEICTDPSYRGQMVVLTHPQVGNYGVSKSAAESSHPLLTALLIRELADFPNHWESHEDLSTYLARWNVPGLDGIDTRALTRRLRSRGALRAVIRQAGPAGFSSDDLVKIKEEAREVTPLSEKLLIPEVSGITPVPDVVTAPGSRVVMVDYGYKSNIARSLQRRGAFVELVPWDAGLDGILANNPDGILLSNGNHPVKDTHSGRVAITSQNHEFQVEAGPALDASGFDVSHVSLNDGSVEGLRHRELPVFSVQFHPEGCPGPQDSQPQFDHFFELIARRRETGARA